VRGAQSKRGEFFTPTAIVQLIVGIIEPFHGYIFDPACGSGCMFVQGARFMTEHKKKPSAELSVYGIGEGRVVEQGTHEELVGNRGMCASFYRRQFVDLDTSSS